mgnify:CR=1 FL=1
MKKKILLAVFALVALTMQAQVDVSVSETVELMSILSRTAGFDEYNMDMGGQYTEDTEQWFAPFKNHPAVTYFRGLRGQYGISHNAPADLAVNLTIENGHVKMATSKECLNDPRWQDVDVDELVTLIDQFYTDTRFHEFYQQHQDFYNEFLRITWRFPVEERELLNKEKQKYDDLDYTKLVSPLPKKIIKIRKDNPNYIDENFHWVDKMDFSRLEHKSTTYPAKEVYYYSSIHPQYKFIQDKHVSHRWIVYDQSYNLIAVSLPTPYDYSYESFEDGMLDAFYQYNSKNVAFAYEDTIQYLINRIEQPDFYKQFDAALDRISKYPRNDAFAGDSAPAQNT